MVGLAFRAGEAPNMTRAVQTAELGDGAILLTSTWYQGEAAGDEPLSVDLAVFRSTPGAVQMRWPGSRYRDPTDWRQVLALPVEVGATWEFRPSPQEPLATATVESIESVETLAGPVADCARVRTVRGGFPSLGWWSPTRGLVRWETWDASGQRLGAFALAPDPWPTRQQVLAFFGLAPKN